MIRGGTTERGRRPALVLTALAAVALLAGACGGSSSSSPDSGDGGGGGDGEVALIQEGKLTVCTHLDYAPFQSRRGGEIVGFDVDVLDEVARDLGVTQAITDTAFEGIESGESLSTNQCDLAAAAMTITDTRREKMTFSEPYFDARQALLVKKGSGIGSLEDLQGKRLGTQLATTGEAYADEHKGMHGYEVVQFEDLPLEVAAVQTGQVDAGINDDSVLRHFIKEHPDVEIAAEFDTGEQYGIAARMGNGALIERVNGTLARIRADGTYDRIYEKWFGETP